MAIIQGLIDGGITNGDRCLRDVRTEQEENYANGCKKIFHVGDLELGLDRPQCSVSAFGWTSISALYSRTIHLTVPKDRFFCFFFRVAND